MEEILENEERERQLKLKEEEMVSVKVYYNEPSAYLNHKYQTMLFHNEQTLTEALSFAYSVSSKQNFQKKKLKIKKIQLKKSK